MVDPIAHRRGFVDLAGRDDTAWRVMPSRALAPLGSLRPEVEPGHPDWAFAGRASR
jgi:hypothetical protein